MTTRYIVRTTRVKKFWVVHHDGEWRFPRLWQLYGQLVCLFRGHQWSWWTCDDYEGPGELTVEGDPDSFMPYLSRRARDGEWAHRGCQRGMWRRNCGISQQRVPEDSAPPLFAGKIMCIDD